MTVFLLGAAVAVTTFLTGVWYGVQVFAPARRAAHAKTLAATQARDADWRQSIKTYEFPDGMLTKASRRCPAGTTVEDLDTGLRQFFLACGSTADLAAAMPSATIDEAWHEFITYTRDYADFCDLAFGRFLHHVPETTMNATELDKNHGRGMLVAWIAACEDENLDFFGATAPTLFAADVRATESLGGRLPNDREATRYIGFCGKKRAKAGTSTRCQSRTGTVCIRHAYTEAWAQFPTQFATANLTPPAPKTVATRTSLRKAITSEGSGRSAASHSTRTRASGSSGTYDATGSIFGFLAASTVADSTPSAPSSHSSCGSTSSSCGSSPSCGGGGCGSA